MQPKLILHAGTHKTGTTAIQAFCSENRDELRRRGFNYPKLPVPGIRAANQHHDLAHAIAGLSPRLTKENAKKLFSQWAATATSSNEAVFLSAEPIWRHQLDPSSEGEMDQWSSRDWLPRRDNYLSELANVIQPFDCQVILVFRNPVDFVQSLYIERITASARGIPLDFPEFTAETLDTVLRYGEGARLFRKHFRNVQCLSYESLCDTNLVEAFFDAVGINIQQMKPGTTVRKSVSPAEAEFINFIKPCIPKNIPKRRAKDLLENAKIRQLIDLYSSENQGSDWWASSAARNATFAAMTTQFRILADEFGVDTTRWQDDLGNRPLPKPLAELELKTKHVVLDLVKRFCQKTLWHGI